MNVDRRHFTRASFALAALTIPGWLAACRREERPDPENDRIASLLGESGGRDVLVFRVHDDAARANDLGLVVGAFLNHGEDADLAPLAVVDIVCVTNDEMRRIAAEVVDQSDVHAVLVRHDGSLRIAVRGSAPPLPIGLAATEENKVWFRRAIDERNAWFARQIVDAIGSDEVTLERAAAAEGERVAGWSSTAEPTFENAQRWPCNARLRAFLDSTTSSAWIEALARVVEECWGEESPPRGSAWAEAASCGGGWKNPPPPSSERERVFVLCGIGHTPTLSARFLHFYSREELGS